LEQRARAEAEEAVRLRDMFLSIASHELKTPLTSLLGNAQLLQRRAKHEGGFSERNGRAIDVIADQAARLNKMIAALLDVSRIETGQLTIERTPLDLGALVRRVVGEIQPTTDQHTIALSMDDEPLWIDGDELRLEQVVHNLVGNAIKYSPQGGPIDVRLERQEAYASVTVRDQGLGIPAAAVPQLFQRFFRANNVDDQHIPGMGIGLFVVNEIVSLHAGTIEVKSREGAGSTFTLCLPLRDSHAA
ncbi:MAG TPA: HAMP domain-containing sensor histidine kinase, partial [Roseiflexaceae bacterium]|nr:HAMP domain-containing sensor histidine kinase [Roseiflexaceae bacterium]